MTDATPTGASEQEALIGSFRIEVPDAELEDLRLRLERTRWPDQLPGTGWDYGVPIDYVRELVDYWRTSEPTHFTSSFQRFPDSASPARRPTGAGTWPGRRGRSPS